MIRRLTFDLTGLPPTPAEVDAFLNDRAAGCRSSGWSTACSPRRTSASAGRGTGSTSSATPRRAATSSTATIPNAWQYRDYVIRALNADVPYDQFVTEHIAGDLARPSPASTRGTGFNESILGTGFWFLGEEVHSPVDIRQDEADRFDNRIDVMTKTFLGLTVACARCHDHKFDAISQRDYYALSGFLISSSYRQARFATIERERQAAETLQALRDAARARRALDRGPRRAAGDRATGRRPLAAAHSLLVDGEFHGGRARAVPNLVASARRSWSQRPLHAIAIHRSARLR